MIKSNCETQDNVEIVEIFKTGVFNNGLYKFLIEENILNLTFSLNGITVICNDRGPCVVFILNYKIGTEKHLYIQINYNREQPNLTIAGNKGKTKDLIDLIGLLNQQLNLHQQDMKKAFEISQLQKKVNKYH